ncbi:MAG: RDD family protein [Nocardioidaceae bacterium]
MGPRPLPLLGRRRLDRPREPQVHRQLAPPAYAVISPDATTADGVALSGWWRRVAARLLDSLITLVISLPLTGFFWYRYLRASLDYQAELRSRGQTQSFAGCVPPPRPSCSSGPIPLTALIALVGAAYEVYFLRSQRRHAGQARAGDTRTAS